MRLAGNGQPAGFARNQLPVRLGFAALPHSAKGLVKAQTTITALYLGSFGQ
jgi:hypothetical protein